MNTQSFTQRAESPIINSVEQRPTDWNVHAISNNLQRITSFQGFRLRGNSFYTIQEITKINLHNLC
jgi:hypothetical protein